MTSTEVDRLRMNHRCLEQIRSVIASTERDERALRVALVVVHEAVRRTLDAAPNQVSSYPSGPRFDDARWGSDTRARLLSYQALVDRVRQRTVAVVPPGAPVAMVSRGDERLLQLDGRTAAHFPQDATGRYAGYYPESAAQGIEQLLDLRSRGTQFVVFPATAFWWLEFYSELATWLAGALIWSCDDCAIYDLTRVGHRQDGGG